MPRPHDQPEKKSGWTALLAAAESLTWARNRDGTPFVKFGGFWYPITSNVAQGWLAKKQIELNVMANNAPDRISKIMGAKLRDTTPLDFSLRMGHAKEAVFLDLGHEDGSIIVVDAAGWRVTQTAPVHFVRSSGMRALPLPMPGGDIRDLLRHINLQGKDLPLVAGWLLALFMPPAPYPLLILNGEQGSAKTTTARLLRSLVDPHETDLRPPFKSEDQLRAMMGQSLIIAFDNLSGITPAQSDILCRLSTGTVIGSRKLYTDGDEYTVRAMKPVLINGISDLVARADLASRAIVLHLPRIPDGQRRTIEDITKCFEAAHPMLLGVLLDGVSMALRELRHLGPLQLPRMADFALWCTAAETALGWQRGAILQAFNENQREAEREILDNDPIAPAIHDLLTKEGNFQGTQADLHRKLDQLIVSCPVKVGALSKHLRRIAPNLRGAGIDIEWKRVGGGTRIIVIRKR